MVNHSFLDSFEYLYDSIYFYTFWWFYIFIWLIIYRLKEVAEKINRYGFVTPPALSGLKTSVKKIVVGPSHIGILLDDNRICRVAFTVLYDRLDLRKNEPNRKWVFVFNWIYKYFWWKLGILFGGNIHTIEIFKDK